MRKLIALLTVLTLALPAMAQIGSQVVWDGAVSNRVFRTNASSWLLNRLLSGAALSANANLSFMVSNNVAAVPSTTVLLSAGGWNTAGVTNSVVLARSVDRASWVNFTNVTVTAPATNTLKGVAEITTLGNYPYVKVADVTNNSSAATTSNSISFHWK